GAGDDNNFPRSIQRGSLKTESINVESGDNTEQSFVSLPLGSEGLGVTIIGTGLIGGSLGLVLKDRALAKHVIAVDNKLENQQRALELSIADEVLPLKDAIAKSNLVVLAVPVDALHELLPTVLDEVEDQVVMDMG